MLLGPSPVELAASNILSTPHEVLEIPIRAYNCLKRDGINNVLELIALSEDQLINIRKLGSKSVDEVRDKLTELGLKFKDAVPGFDSAYFGGGFDEDQI